MVTALWIVFEILTLWYTDFLNREMTRGEKWGLVLFAIVIALVGGYREYRDSVQMDGISHQLAALHSGQEFTKGQLDVIGKTISGQPQSISSDENAAPSVLLLPASNQLNLFNRGNEDIQLIGDYLAGPDT